MSFPSYGNPHVDDYFWGLRQHAAAFYLFIRVPEAFNFVTRHGIAKKELLETSKVWSRSEQILVRIALDLFDPGCVEWNGSRPVHLGDIAAVLDDGNLQRVLDAIRIVRGSARVADLLGIEKKAPTA